MDWTLIITCTLASIGYGVGSLLFQVATHGYADVPKLFEVAFHQIFLFVFLFGAGVL